MAFHHPNRKRKGHFVSPLDQVAIPALTSLEATGTYNTRLSDWLEALRRQLSFWAGVQTQTPEGALRQWMELHALDFELSAETDVLMIWNPRWKSAPCEAGGPVAQQPLF